MKNYKNTVVIYPDDPTLNSLKSIFEKLKEIFPESNNYRPKYEDTILSTIEDSTDLVIFLGHGAPSRLFGGVNDNGEKGEFCNYRNAINQLKGCSIILYACNSIDFLKNISASAQIKNYIVFGDMPSDMEHVRHNQKYNCKYWTQCNEKQLSFYEKTIDEAVLNGLEKAYMTNSFYGLKKGVEHVVNVKINEIINNTDWTKTQKLQLIERIVEFKNDIKCNESIVAS
jgi:hypothetical protein